MKTIIWPPVTFLKKDTEVEGISKSWILEGSRAGAWVYILASCVLGNVLNSFQMLSQLLLTT